MNKSYFILLAVFMGLWFLFTPFGNYKDPMEGIHGFYHVQRIDPGDDTGYYAYLRSGFIEGDFDFYNEEHYFHFNKITDTGYTANYWYIGAPIIWFPFFLLGHIVALIYLALGFPVALDGYSFPYYAFTSIASSLEVFAGLVLCYKIIADRYGKSVSLAVTVLVLAATCLPYFAFVRNRMSHSGDFLVAFLFFWTFLKFRERPNQSIWFFIMWGALAGLLADLRYISVIWCAFPLGFLIKTLLDKGTTSDDRARLLKNYLFAFLAFLVVVSPQLASWKMLHGVFSSLNPYTNVVSDFGSLFQSIWNVFLGAKRGLFLVEPVWALGLIGLFMLMRKDPWLGGVCWVVFLGFLTAPVIIGDPATFGQRYLIPAFPLLALGLGECLAPLFKKRPATWFRPVGALLCFWMYFMTFSFNLVIPFKNQNFVPEALSRFAEVIHTNRFLWPTSYLDLILKGKFQLLDYRDYFFLIGLPLLEILFCFAALFLILRVIPCLTAEPGRTSALKWSSLGFLTCMVCLTAFIVLNHPELPAYEKKNRLQSAAINEFYREYPSLTRFKENIERSQKAGAPDAKDYALLADASFLSQSFKEATFYYKKAQRLHDSPSRALQLERLAYLTGQRKYPKVDVSQFDMDKDGSLHRNLGLYFLDSQNDITRATVFLLESIKINPQQKLAGGIKLLISQAYRLNSKLGREKKTFKDIPKGYGLMLNTQLFTTELTG